VIDERKEKAGFMGSIQEMRKRENKKDSRRMGDEKEGKG